MKEVRAFVFTVMQRNCCVVQVTHIYLAIITLSISLDVNLCVWTQRQLCGGDTLTGWKNANSK